MAPDRREYRYVAGTEAGRWWVWTEPDAWMHDRLA
jgi:hypothetical protein